MTALAPWLLELLACPQCRSGLSPQANGTALRCAQCAVSYPIRDGIPVLLVSEATGEGRDDLDEGQKRT